MSLAPVPRRAFVIVASTRAASSRSLDTTGPMIHQWLVERGFETPAPSIVADGAPVATALRAALASRPHVILTTGGTGVSPTDRTPEQTRPLLDMQVLGIPERIRSVGGASFPTAALTRGLAGFAGSTFILNLPGSPGGVRDGLAVLGPILDHLLAQRDGVVEH